MAYATIPAGTVLSELVDKVEIQHEQMRSLERSTVALGPTIKPVGLIHNRTDHGTIGEAWMRWNGTAYTLLLDPEATQINASGTIAFAANQAMGGFVLTGLGAGSANGHSVRYEQVMLLSGANAMAANLNMGSHKITSVTDPTANQDAATKKYVDDTIAASTGVGRVQGTVAAPSNFSTWQQVTLAFTPTVVLFSFQAVNVTVGLSTDLNVVSTTHAFSAGTGTENGMVLADCPVALSGLTVFPIIFEFTTSPVGFRFRINNGSANYGGSVKYVAFK